MAKLSLPEESYADQFGPHLNYQPEDGWDTREPDKLVDTHCCFCGVQCGVTLKVKENKVIGFEPREDFPVNKGKLCPKGVKRYLQNEHPDRLKSPLVADSITGFRKASWDEAYSKTADEIKRIQEKYGKDAFAFLGGASMTNEKAYLNGKFARVALQTANIDYNGRLCMVSAGAANKIAFGIDRAANPWSDIPKAKTIILAGTNLAECFPVLTQYIWQARDNGAKIIVIDPRITPIARTADLFLPVKPGRDSALANGILHQLIKNDWIDQDYLDNHTDGWDEVAATVEKFTPEYTEKITGVPAASVVKAGELWGPVDTSMLLHARGIEHHTKGVENVLSYMNLVLATGRIGKEGCGYGSITGQGNGQGGREHGQRCNQLPGGRDINNKEHREHIAKIWGVEEQSLPYEGLTACEIIDAIEEGKIKGLLSISFNPLVSIPDSDRTRKALEKLEFFGCIDFFMNETARYADVVLAGSLQEEDEGTVTTGEGRCVKLNQSVTPPGDAKTDWQIICDLAARLGKKDYFDYTNTGQIFEELARASAGGVNDYSGMTWERIEQEQGVFWPCPSPSHPGTPRLFEDKKFYHPNGRAKMKGFDYRPPAEDVCEEYPIMYTTGRVVSQYLSGTQTRRIGSLVDQYPEPLCEMHPMLAEQLGIKDGDTVKVSSRRGSIILPAQVVQTIRPDTVFIPYHWADKKAANQLTNRKLDPISKIPEFKICACKVEKLEDAPTKFIPLAGQIAGKPPSAPVKFYPKPPERFANS
ncbi:molybdopterin oxidoreductase family protein [Pelagicoccus sp. SDUM812005]|uniref:molybdopterin oxidoreductase family protein n=1 Tax=Pelagicoccus sp. SDUM812005 TaxID=3041257 RepID=UPI00280CB29D|nr:molybdopterin oxidoreductase family protein [Pelagicoccus sp. SDUM812005]MDQ8183268.1 molybdopterin oxidoreductase family protein [Pelagicoccus sp. SDUM812005]